VGTHRLKIELKHHGRDFAAKYDHVDEVFGGDHGARHFKAVVQVIFRKMNNPDIPTSTITLQVGHIDAAKDTYKVLQEIIAHQLNVGLRQIVNKVNVLHFVGNHDPLVVFADELPAANENNNYAALGIQAFVSGDLAYFATILRKPNMSPVWCNWCILFKGMHLDRSGQ
jgi:hypothetical protein